MIKFDARNNSHVDILASTCEVVDTLQVPRARDVLSTMHAAILTDAKRLGELATQRQARVECSLTEAHYRFLANMRETEATEKSLHAVVALIGPAGFNQLMDADKSGRVWFETELSPSPTELRDQATLWEHIHTYLGFVREARISEVGEFFLSVGIVTTRQAIESSLRTHPKAFGLRKRGRELFLYRRDMKWSDPETATPIRPTRRRT